MNSQHYNSKDGSNRMLKNITSKYWIQPISPQEGGKKKHIAKPTPSVASSVHQNLLMPVFPNAYKRNLLQELRKLFKMAVLLRDSSLSPSSSLQFFSLAQAGYCDHFSQFPGGIF